MPIEQIKETASNIAPHILYGSFGGAVMYLNHVRNGEKFRITMFVLNIIIAGWIGFVLGEAVSDSFGKYQSSIISICGFLSHPILDFIEKRGFNLLLKKITGKQ